MLEDFQQISPSWRDRYLAASIFWLWMLIDAIRRDFADPIMKVVWIVVVLFGHLLGAIVYYFAGRERGRLPV